ENKALSAYFQGRTNREPLLLTPVTKPPGRTLDSFAETELRLPIELPAGLIHIQVDVVDFARPSGSVTGLEGRNAQRRPDRLEHFIVGGRHAGRNVEDFPAPELQGLDAGSRDVRDFHVIARLLAVSVNGRRDAGQHLLAEDGDHAGLTL